MVLSAYIVEWMQTFKAYSVKRSTYDRLQTSAKALEGFSIASMPINEITPVHIQKYLNELVEHGYGYSTIKKQLRIVTAPLKQAAALHLIPADPCVGIKMPLREHVKKASRAVDAYSPEEQKALCKVLETYKRKGYAAILLMMETGLRAGEALALRWRDVQFANKRLFVRATVVNLANRKQSFVQDSPKSHFSNRTIPLTPRAIEILLHQPQETEWVFPTHNGERLSYEALRYQTICACREAGVEFRGEHVFRHTFATNCYHNGVNIKILSRLLGHADVNITYNIYVHLYGDGFDEMYDALVPKEKTTLQTVASAQIMEFPRSRVLSG